MGVGFNEGLYRHRSSPWFLTHLSLLVCVPGTVFYVRVRNADTAQCLEKGRQTSLFKVKGSGEQQSLRCKCLNGITLGGVVTRVGSSSSGMCVAQRFVISSKSVN